MEQAGRLRLYPDWYPLQRWEGLTEEQFQNLISSRNIIQQDAVKIVFDTYQIQNWVNINQYAKIDITQWVGLAQDPFTNAYGLPTLFKDAIAMAVENINRDIDRQRQEQKLAAMEAKKPVLEALGSVARNNSMDKVFR